MYCKNCGKLLSNSEAFCPECGTKNEEIGQEKLLDAQGVSIKEKQKTNKEKVLNILPLCGFIFSAVGVGIFLIVVFAGLIGYGKIYLFNGDAYAITKAAVIISIVLMLLGVISLVVKFILILTKKADGFPVKMSTKIIAIVLIVFSIGFSVWGFINAGLSNKEDYYPYYPPTPTYSLDSAYNEAGCASPWATRGSSYIKVDTNPYDIDGSTTYVYKATAAIKKLNRYFGVPDYVYDDMMNTRAIDGRQSYSGSRINIYWRYHPDSGLEVTYSK